MYDFTNYEIFSLKSSIEIPIPTQKTIIIIIDEGNYWKKSTMDKILNELFVKHSTNTIYILFTGSYQNIKEQLNRYNDFFKIFTVRELYRTLLFFNGNKIDELTKGVVTKFKTNYIAKYGETLNYDLEIQLDFLFSQISNFPYIPNHWLQLNKFVQHNNIRFNQFTNKKQLINGYVINVDNKDIAMSSIEKIMNEILKNEKYEFAQFLFNLKEFVQLAEKKTSFYFSVMQNESSTDLNWYSKSIELNKLITSIFEDLKSV